MTSASRNLLPALFLTWLFVAGCGGGTSGTGVNTVYQGTVTDTAGHPLAGVIVSVEETGANVTTDMNGMFSIELDTGLPANTITFNGPFGESAVSVPTAPGSAPAEDSAIGSGAQVTASVSNTG